MLQKKLSLLYDVREDLWLPIQVFAHHLTLNFTKGTLCLCNRLGMRCFLLIQFANNDIKLKYALVMGLGLGCLDTSKDPYPRIHVRYILDH